MKKLGLYLIIGGVGSIILNQFGYEFELLMWIDAWGNDVARLIRASAIILGIGIFVFSKDVVTDENEEEEDTELEEV